MKSGSKLSVAIFSALGIALLILDAKTALQGAQEGVALCLRTVVPSLFPFFIFSILLTSTVTGQRIPGFRLLGKLCGIPAGAESLLLAGFLGGYPVGAQSIAQAYLAGQLKAQDARRMLGFCNNAGPAFIFGMAGALFHSIWVCWILWGIHILSALVVALLLPGKSHGFSVISTSWSFSLTQAMKQAVRIMAEVCGWIVLFRVFIAILGRWCLWLLPQTVQISFIGLLELSNGCYDLIGLGSESLRFLLCACFLGFGGLCIAMQTMSVTSGLGTGDYFPGKILQGCLSLCLAAFAQQLLFPASERTFIHPAIVIAFLCGICVLLLFLKKTVEIRIPLMYNKNNITAEES